MPKSIPKVAQVEDYDSDESSVKPGTLKEARRKTMMGPPKAMARYKNGQADGASDSGYSSRTTGTQESNASVGSKTAAPVQPPSRPSTTQGQARPKPVIHRTDSQSTRPRAPSRSASSSRRGSEQCSDLNCRHSSCLAVRYPGRRFSITEQAPQYAPQYAASPSPTMYQQVPQYQYAQVSQPQPTQKVPVLTNPRPRSQSASRQARPVSVAGYPYQHASGTSTPGPPPSNSAYQNLAEQWAHYYHQLQLHTAQQIAYQQQQQQAAAYAAANQAQSYPVQPQPSPVNTSPTSAKFSTSARLQRAYSARIATPVSATATSMPQNFPTSRNTSSRQMSARSYNVPGAFPDGDDASSESDSSSDSDSSSEMSEEEYERERRARARARDSRLMSSSSQRRPSMNKKYVTEPVVPTVAKTRDILHRNLRSEYNLDYVSSSDNMDSDRTTRAIVDRPRTTYTDSTRSSRRPSLSTTASSGRTRATTMSSATSGMDSLVLEGRKGRQIAYLSGRDREALHRKYAREQEEEEERRRDIEAYQDAIRGGKVAELTAEKLKMQQMHSSGGSYAHSRKSSRSSSRAYNPGEAVKIEVGGATLHVYGDQKVEMIPGRDGTASLVIGSKSGRDSTYLGGSSKSSSSRVGRSQGGSDVGARREETIREEYTTETVQPAT